MPAGLQTAFNSAAVWNDLVKLSPMVWMQGAQTALSQVQPVMDLYEIDTLDQFNRDYSYIADSGFGKVIAEGADYSTRTINQGDTLSLTVIKRGDAATITEDLVDGNKYREIGKKLTNLGASLFRTRARDATHVGFTYSPSTSYTDAEGNTVTNAVAKGSEALYADTHTMGDGSTFDNLQGTPSPLGESTLRTLQDLTVDFLDENGIPVSTWGTSGDLVLWTSFDVSMDHAAYRLTEQDWNYNSSNRDISTFKGVFRHVKLAYLATTATGARDTTKEKFYGILDMALMKDGAIFGDHTLPTPDGPFTDMYNGGMLWRSKSRYDIGFIYAHVGAASNSTT